MADKKKGYKNGDKCPKCGGLITIRTLQDGKTEYVQCAHCSFNTLR